MQQGKVILWMRALMGLHRLRQLSHHWAKSLPGVEPMGKQMHAHKRRVVGEPEDFCARGNVPRALSLTRAARATIDPSCDPLPIDKAHAHRKRYLTLCDPVDQHPAWAL